LYPDLPRDLIRTFFADYLHLVEADAARKMRLDRITFPQSDFEHGVVAEIHPGKGEPVIVVVRIESGSEAPRPLAEDLRRLDLRYGQPVLVSVLRLTGGRPGAHLESEPIGELFGIELARIFYTVFGLDGARAEYYLERPEPLAWALSAWMRPFRRDPEEHRRACLERIEASALPEMQRELLRRAFEEDRGQLPQESALVSWIGANGVFSRLS
jgi:hypothetical protein